MSSSISSVASSQSVSYFQAQLNPCLVYLQQESLKITNFHFRHSNEIRVVAKGLKNILAIASNNSLVFDFKPPAYSKVLGFLAHTLGFKTYKGLLTSLSNGCDIAITPELISSKSLNQALGELLNKNTEKVSDIETLLVSESLNLMMNWHTAYLFSRIAQSNNSALGELLFFHLAKASTQRFELILGLLLSSVVKGLPKGKDSPICVNFIKAPKEELLNLNNNLVVFLGCLFNVDEHGIVPTYRFLSELNNFTAEIID